jgi:hypothetical protein
MNAARRSRNQIRTEPQRNGDAQRKQLTGCQETRNGSRPFLSSRIPFLVSWLPDKNAGTASPCLRREKLAQATKKSMICIADLINRFSYSPGSDSSDSRSFALIRGHFCCSASLLSAVKMTLQRRPDPCYHGFQVSMDARFGYILTSPTNYDLDE